jgi:ribosome-associated protein
MRERDGTIRLDQYLKLAGVAATGGQAKTLVQHGFVRVNGEPETRRGRKLHGGDTVSVEDRTLVVELGSGDPGGGGDDTPLERTREQEHHGEQADHGAGDPTREFWEDPERVRRFADRPPDQRLTELLAGYPEPAATHVLDLGCAGGRNTALLVERGFDVTAVDASRAMVAHTRVRVAALRDAEEAERRVLESRMDDLGWAADGSFALIVALGIYHEARDDAEWLRALAESARLLAPGGRLLVATFAPGTVLHGDRPAAVPGSPRTHRRGDGTTCCLVDAATLDRDLGELGLAPAEPTRTVERDDGTSHRVTHNGLFVKV